MAPHRSGRQPTQKAAPETDQNSVREPSFTLAGHRLSATPCISALYIVSTPIGHLKDITIRALETLAGVDIVLCEDTRVSEKLLSHYGIKAQKRTYNDHSSDHTRDQIIDDLTAGKSVALISDAGTPLVSDPGHKLIQCALEAGIEIVPIPGASALLSALVASNLPGNSISFEGFLPVKAKAKSDCFEKLKTSAQTVIFYDSPKRILNTLKLAKQVLGPARTITIAREMTKRFETFVRGSIGDVLEKMEGSTIKGEIVLLIGPSDVDIIFTEDEWTQMLNIALQTMRVKEAAQAVAAQTGLDRRTLYQKALEIQKNA